MLAFPSLKNRRVIKKKKSICFKEEKHLRIHSVCLGMCHCAFVPVSMTDSRCIWASRNKSAVHFLSPVAETKAEICSSIQPAGTVSFLVL